MDVRFAPKRPRLPPEFLQENNENIPMSTVSESQPQSVSIEKLRRNIAATTQQLRENGANLEEHADQIVEKLEQNVELMEDTPESEQLRREALRDMPQSLTLKRCVKVKLKKSVSRKSKHKPIGYWKSLKYNLSVKWDHLKIWVKNMLFSLELWYGTMKKIEGCFGSGVASYFRFHRWLFIMNSLVMGVVFIFIVLPQLFYENSASINFPDLFIGGSSLTDSALFYGFYTNNSLTLAQNLPYKIPHAYFYTMVIVYFGCFAILSISAAKTYNKHFIETEGGLKNIFANKIFCGWDFSIATKDGARIKSAAIYHDLKELINEHFYENSESTIWKKLQTLTLQLIINLFVAIAIAATGYGLWHLRDDFKNNLAVVHSIIFDLIIIIYPVLISIIVRFENYKFSKNELTSALLKTSIFYGVLIGILVAQTLIEASPMKCWENNLGQEIYRLIIYDFALIIILEIFEIMLYFFGKRLEFNIGISTLQIIYNQILFWVGLWFSPILPVIVTIKLLILWYCKSFILQKLCKPIKKLWRATQIETYFLLMIFVAMLAILATFGYYFARISASNCGPFKNFEFVFDIVTKDIKIIEEEHWFWRLLMLVTKPGVIALILIFLAVRVYYLRIKANAQRAMVEVVREMLVWEARDKDFLLSCISKVSNGEYHHKSQVFDPVNMSIPAMRRDVDEFSEVDEDFYQYKKFN